MLFSVEQKMKLRIAAGFLRKRGFNFVEGNFYDSVHSVLCGMVPEERVEMNGLIDWVLDYQRAEGCAPAAAQNQKPFNKERTGGASRRLP